MKLPSKVFRLQQIELQRMLFYSYQVGEDRFYQEVESIDELYKIVEQCLEEYNQTHKTQMNLVIFRYRPSFLIWNVSVLYDTNDVSTVLCYLLNGFQCCMVMYRKIPKVSPVAYIYQRPF